MYYHFLVIAGLCLTAYGFYISVKSLRHLYYMATVRIFVFNNQDLNRLGDDIRQQLNKPNVVVINFWAPEQKVYMYFRSMYAYTHLHETFSLGEYEPEREYVIGNSLELILEKLRTNKLSFKSMSGNHL